MAEYSIGAPDGKTYKITGPPGASQQDVEQEVMRQNPHLGASPPPPDAPPSARSPILQRGDGSVIRGPNTFGENLLGHLYEALPFIGSAGGAAVGTGLAPGVGTATGGVLGNMVGRQGSRVLAELVNRLRGLPDRQPDTDVLGNAKKIATEDLPLALANEAGGVLGGRVLGMLRPRTPAPETLAAREAAARQGITMTPAAEQGSPALAKVQALPAHLPIGGGPAREGLAAAKESARGGVERMVQGAGGRYSLPDAIAEVQATTESLREATREAPGELMDRFLENTIGTSRMGKLALGGSAQEALRDVSGAARAQASLIYNRALSEGGRGMPVPMGTTHPLSSEMAATEYRLRGLGSPASGKIDAVRRITEPQPIQLDEEALAAMAPADRYAMLQRGAGSGSITVGDLPVALIERYGLSRNASIPLEDAVELQQRLRAAMRSPTDDFSRRQIRDLANAVTDDIRKFGASSGNTRFGPLLQQASDFYKQEVAQDFAKKGLLRGLTDKRVGLVGDQILKTRDPEVIRGLMGRLPERQQDEIRRGVLEKMRTAATDPMTGQLSVDKLERAFTMFGDENLGYLMGPKVRELDALRRTLRGVGATTADTQVYERMLRGSANALANQFSGGNARTVDDLLTLWPRIAPDQQRGLARGLLTNTLEHAVNPETGEFSMARYVSAAHAVPPRVWATVLSTTEREVLHDLQTVFRHTASIDRWAANNSGTYYNLLAAGQLLGISGASMTAIMHPSTIPYAAAKIGLETGGPYALGRFVFSPTGRRFLVAPDAPAAASSPSGVAKMLYRLLTTQTAEQIRPAVKTNEGP